MCPKSSIGFDKAYFQALDVIRKGQFNMNSFMPWDSIMNNLDQIEINTSKSIGKIFKTKNTDNLSDRKHHLHLTFPMMAGV